MAEHRITLAGKGIYHRDWIDRYQDPDTLMHTLVLPPASELGADVKTAVTTFRLSLYECLSPIMRNHLDMECGMALHPVKYTHGRLRNVAGNVRFYTKSNVGVADVPFTIELGQKDLEFIFQKSVEETARDILENIVSGRTPAA